MGTPCVWSFRSFLGLRTEQACDASQLFMCVQLALHGASVWCTQRQCEVAPTGGPMPSKLLAQRGPRPARRHVTRPPRRT